jgi:hypothetical protein
MKLLVFLSSLNNSGPSIPETMYLLLSVDSQDHSLKHPLILDIFFSLFVGLLLKEDKAIIQLVFLMMKNKKEKKQIWNTEH